jgi:L-fuconate dehydratase
MDCITGYASTHGNSVDYVEPTSPDDVLGHATIRKALQPKCKVATGEHIQNRIIFKQLFQAEAIDFCQIDSCRVAGVNEIMAILLMAKKFKVPVVPHAGGVGLCEHVQHLSLIDYICVSADLNVLEFVDHLHEHFVNPVVVKNGHYTAPLAPGYSIEMKRESIEDYSFPTGKIHAQSN